MSRAAIFWLAAGAGSCAHQGVNYPTTPGPCIAAPATARPVHRGADTLKVVTWNIKWGIEAQAAAEMLATDEALRDADIVVLQEMYEGAVELVAARLGAGYVYYAATLHPKLKRHVGNAILSRWPITDDRKLVLPHDAWFIGTGRAAVIGTVTVRGLPIRVYGVHFATAIAVGDRGIRDQLRAVMRNADSTSGPVLIAGDFNSTRAGGLLLDQGYAWHTRRIGPTAAGGLALDHIFTRSITVASSRVGSVRAKNLPSDHRPVWALIALGAADPVP
jgi:endonuclease/exonuclease/phosphatase family metal-dependent hydrolase